MSCERWKDHRPQGGVQEARSGGCRHTKAENMTKGEFRRLPRVRCMDCQTALGVICPECRRFY